MKHFILFMVALGMLVWISAVFGQEEAAVGEEMERELDMRRAQLELQEHEGEVDFRREMRQLELEKKRMGLEHWKKSKKHHDDKGGAVLLFVLLIVHILLAVWVYQDIRKRNTGSGIWIVVALLAGLFGTLVYAIVRLGDAKATS
jgi:Flp pilus assembly protein TadB